MRRVLLFLGLIGLGVVVGFGLRLVLPRRGEPVVYALPMPGEVSGERRNA
jgi:hypothetical protein